MKFGSQTSSHFYPAYVNNLFTSLPGFGDGHQQTEQPNFAQRWTVNCANSLA